MNKQLLRKEALMHLDHFCQNGQVSDKEKTSILEFIIKETS